MTTEFHRGATAGRRNGSGSRWRNGFWRVVRSFSGDHDLWSVSAGVAFYAWYAAVFGVVFLVSLYGLGAEPQSVRAKIEALSGALPSGAVRFLADQMQSVTTAPRPRLGTSLAFALLLALWSARAAVATLIAALNITFQERESRSVLRLQIVTLSLTLGAVLFVTAALALALLLPEAVDRWPGDPAVKAGIAAARWPALALLMWLALATLYRFAPCRRKSQWRWASGGAAVATALWVLGSAGLSYVVANFSSGSAAFGALSAVLVMQTWFYVAALAVLLGARLNAEAEHQTTGGGAE